MSFVSYLAIFLAAVAAFFVNCAAALAQSKVVEAIPEIRRPTIALALGGGGARCAAHIGVLRALEKANIKVDYIVGCSMGAVIGGLYCAGLTPDQIEALMLKKDGVFHALIPTPIVLRLIGHGPSFAAHIVRYPKEFGLYNGEALSRFIDDAVPENNRQIEKLDRHFAAVSVDLVDGQTVIISRGDLGRAVQASCALPGLFKASRYYTGKLLIDGGLRSNVPAKEARLMGADIVIAVDADERLTRINAGEFKMTGQLTNRLISILLDSIDEHQMENADLQIRPDTAGISLYSRRRTDIINAINAGERAADASLDQLRAKISKNSSASLAK